MVAASTDLGIADVVPPEACRRARSAAGLPPHLGDLDAYVELRVPETKAAN
jgi:hypothetical protein